MGKPLILFVTAPSSPILPADTPSEKRLEVNVAFHIGEMVRQCDRDHLPMLASYLLDSMMAVLCGAGVPKEVALQWIEKVGPDAYELAAESGLITTAADVR